MNIFGHDVYLVKIGVAWLDCYDNVKVTVQKHEQLPSKPMKIRLRRKA